VERLYIRGREQTKLLDGLASQIAEVTAALAAVDAPVPVRGVLCFVGTELPWFGESIGGVPLVAGAVSQSFVMLIRFGPLPPSASGD